MSKNIKYSPEFEEFYASLKEDERKMYAYSGYLQAMRLLKTLLKALKEKERK